MSTIERTVLIARSAEQMFTLVDRVEDYPKFLPWCGKIDLLERNEHLTAARIHIHFKGLRAHFATENPKEAPHRMDIHLREGPFKRLEGRWLFTALGEAGCKIVFRLQYEFSSRILEKALGPVFNQIITTFVDGFIRRAEEVYG